MSHLSLHFLFVLLLDSAPAGPTTTTTKASPTGYTITPLPSKSQPRRAAAAEADSSASEPDDGDDDGGWETASDDDDDDEAVATTGIRPKAAAAAASAGDGRSGRSNDGDGDDDDDDDDWEEWDVCRSFFDNHVSSSMQDNLEYMYKKFGFYLPDAECLVDPEGMLKYLGEKLQYGKVSRGGTTGQYKTACWAVTGGQLLHLFAA
jgi:hypothetical protein